MEKLFDLGTTNLYKFWGNKSDKKSDCHAFAKLTVAPIGSCSLLITTELFVYDTETGHCIIGGDCFSDATTPDLLKSDLFNTILNIHDKYQHKIIRTGTPEQMTVLKEAIANKEITSLSPSSVDEHKAYLEAHNMLTVPKPDGTKYTYGEGCIDADTFLDPDDLTTIKHLLGLN